MATDPSTSLPNDAEPQPDVELSTELQALKWRLDRLRIRREFFPADVTIMACGAICWEHGNAIIKLYYDTEYHDALFPLARAIFEAGLDALHLATEPGYLQSGARARVFELLEFADIRAALGGALSIDEYGSVEEEHRKASESVVAMGVSGTPTQVHKAMTDALAHFAPRFAAAHRRSRHPGHWSELSRRKQIALVAGRVGVDGLEKRLAAFYSSLSRSTHPRVRAESLERARSGEQSAFRRRPTHGRIALRLAAGGISLMAVALDTVAKQYAADA